MAASERKSYTGIEPSLRWHGGDCYAQVRGTGRGRRAPRRRAIAMNSDARLAHVEVNAERVFMPREAIALIERAVAAIESDRDRARQCLTQASALLRRESVVVAGTSATVEPRAAWGGLARWQLSRVIAHIEGHLAGPIRMRE